MSQSERPYWGKIKNNQEVKSDKILTAVTSLMMLVIGVLFVTGRAWQGRLKDIAKVESEKIAIQLISSWEKRDSRNPASIQVNEISNAESEDPWGNPYKLRWIRAARKHETYVVVWSFGPNQTNDSNLNWLESVESRESIFNGDDVGVVKMMVKKTLDSSLDSSSER